MMRNYQLFIGILMGIIVSCGQTGPGRFNGSPAENNKPERDTTQVAFWHELKSLCGNAYSGTIIAGGENDTVFGGKPLIMHVRACSDSLIRIPFFVGSDSSRTWVLTLTTDGILLKHDHRHRDGSPDEVTMYGGHTSNYGSPGRQFFPADQETASMLPAATGNIWWIELVPGEYFSYNLRRVNTPRLFSVRFDLVPLSETPGAPWGWQD